MSKADCEKAFKRLLEVCAIDVPSLGKKKIVPIKRKRPMSGYNCFTKNLYTVEKEKAKQKAENQCHIKSL